MVRARRARPGDVPAIHRLVAHYAAKGLLLPRAEDEIRAHFAHFLVLTEKTRSNGRAQEQLVGCVALESYGADLAEIRSLAVDPEIHGRGLGARLLKAALAAARRRKIARVFAVTHAPDFFRRHGFSLSTRWALPEKLERDCRSCPKASYCRLSTVIATVCLEPVALAVSSENASSLVRAKADKPAPAL